MSNDRITAAWTAIHNLRGPKGRKGQFLTRAAKAAHFRRTAPSVRAMVAEAIAAGEADPVDLGMRICGQSAAGGLYVTGLRWWLGASVEADDSWPSVDACRAFVAGGSVVDLAKALGVEL